MLEFFNQLSWPAAFAIVGSLVTIVTGLFGYVLRQAGDASKQRADQLQLLHARISEVKERLNKDEGDNNLLHVKFDNIQKQLDDHEERDERNFGQINTKMDKMHDILMKILTDEKL